MEIGSRIKQLRKESGLTQAEFGSRIGISLSGVSSLEIGKNTPSEQTIRAICSEFSINRDWLVDGIGEMHVQKPLLPELIHNLRHYPLALEFLATLNADEWKTFEAVLTRYFDQKNKKETE